MNDLTHSAVPIKQYRIILVILLIEVSVYFFSGIQVASFVNNTFISFEQDPLLWVVYFTGIPNLILSSNFLSYSIDVCIVVFLLLLIWNPVNRLTALALFVSLFIFYFIFTGHLGHRNYQSGYLFVLLPLLFLQQKNRQITFELTRYFLLFFYVSAAFYKLKSGSLFYDQHFSHTIINQFTPYFLEHNYSLRTGFHTFLISHSNFSSMLYIGAALFEFAAVVGFFTKRYDTLLGILFLLFHFANWFIMDIAPIGQIAFICTLFFSRKFEWKSSVL